jgi:hypothetical protein
VRRAYLIAIVIAVILFVVISALLARAFSADGAERSAVTSLVKAEARGDANGIIDRIEGCRTSRACRSRAAYDAHRLRHPGAISILQIQPSTGFSLTSTLGYARVAWNVGGSLPIVQCVKVRRAGDVLRGLRIELLWLTVKLRGDASCPPPSSSP